jgi:hypothetical protein
VAWVLQKPPSRWRDEAAALQSGKEILMATEASLTVEILKQIRDEGRKTNQRLDETSQRLSERLDQLRAETRQGFAMVGDRLDRIDQRMDNFLTGEHRRDHEELRERVSRLEQHVGLTRQ